MRQVKFRIWDKRIEDGVMSYDDGHFGISAHGEVFCVNEDTDISKEVILMQYTGLTDKTGNDVYEGDIVKCSSGCPHEVIWLEEYGGTFFGGMPAWYLSGLKEGYAWSGTEEIIGNRFEHPDLLEGLK